MKENSLTIHTTTKGKLPRLPFAHIKESILPSDYSVSLVFVGERRARVLNTTYRSKTYVPNVLAFPLTKKSGEIFICPAVAKRQAHKFDRTPEKYIGFLFIHALFHLKGLDHSSRMERLEETIRVKFHI